MNKVIHEITGRLVTIDLGEYNAILQQNKKLNIANNRTQNKINKKISDNTKKQRKAHCKAKKSFEDSLKKIQESNDFTYTNDYNMEIHDFEYKIVNNDSALLLKKELATIPKLKAEALRKAKKLERMNLWDRIFYK